MGDSRIEGGRWLVDGEPFKAIGVTVHKVTRKLHLHERYGIPLPDVINPYKSGSMDSLAFLRLLRGLKGTRINTIHAYLRLSDDGDYVLPFPESGISDIEELGFKLVLSLPFHWVFFPGFETIAKAVSDYRDLGPLVMWVIGAEVFDRRYRVPFKLIEEVNSLVKSLSDIPTTYGNMPFNNAPSRRFRMLGVQPVSCTDTVGYFDFTPLQLLSMSEFMLASWWMVQDSFKPITRKLVGFWFSIYNAFMNLMPRSDGEYKTIDSNLGYRRALKRQLRFSSVRGKPLVVAQAGLSDNPAFVGKQLEIIDELDVAGYFYWNSANLDPNYDGVIENTELLDVFRGGKSAAKPVG